ncbi:hypothetical protein BGZ81_001755, partial [Podila clonocystis]
MTKLCISGASEARTGLFLTSFLEGLYTGSQAGTQLKPVTVVTLGVVKNKEN